MGNKLFKVGLCSMQSASQVQPPIQVHVKYSSKSVEVTLSPDTSVLQLKEKISSEFNVDPERQILHCNGKLMDADDNVTIKQAKIPNGSKILCTLSRCVADPVVEHLQRIGSNADDLAVSLDKLVKERKMLTKEQPSLFLEGESEDFKRCKFECKKLGEHLMRLLESLDSLDCSDQSHRATRKQLATKINSILDKNDKLGNQLNRDSKS